MNVFGIGPLELVVIIILALIFLGPEELPTIARKLGTLMRELQSLSEEFQEQVKKELGPELEELEKVTKGAQKAGKTLQTAQQAARQPKKFLEEEVLQAINPSNATPSAPADTPTESEEATPAKISKDEGEETP